MYFCLVDSVPKREEKFERKKSEGNLTWAVCYILTRITEQKEKQINSKPRVGHRLLSTVNKPSMRTPPRKEGGYSNMTQIGSMRNSSERNADSCLHTYVNKMVH